MKKLCTTLEPRTDVKDCLRLSGLAEEGALAVIAPHPDDETLGCGGLIALAAAQRRKLVIIVLTGGDGSHPGSRRYPPARLASLRAKECQAAMDVLTAESVTPIMLGLPDGGLEACGHEDVGQLLAALFRLHHVRAAFVTDGADEHPDHRAAYRAARVAADKTDVQLWRYPVWQDMDHGVWANAPSLDISDVRSLKSRGARRHRSQVSRLIRDSADAFRLRRGDLRRFVRTTEVYLRDET